MLGDHSHVATRTKQALTDMRATMPAVMLDARDQQELDRLKTASHESFDNAYVESQIQAHSEATALLSDHARNDDDPKLKLSAGQVLPAKPS